MTVVHTYFYSLVYTQRGCRTLKLNRCMQPDSKICGFGCEFLVTIVLINVSRNCSLIDRDPSDEGRICSLLSKFFFFSWLVTK